MQYTSFAVLRNNEGYRVYGSFQGGDWYEFAHNLAQTKSTGQPVSVFPLIASCDVTYGRKNLPMYPEIIAAGCVSDDVRSEPGSWFLIAMLPHYKNSPAELAGRVDEGPHGIRRRRVEVHHMAQSLITGELNQLSARPMPMEWADGVVRDTLIMMAARIGDQPQHDLSCAEPAQTCKQCNCPKHLLHNPLRLSPPHPNLPRLNLLRLSLPHPNLLRHQQTGPTRG